MDHSHSDSHPLLMGPPSTKPADLSIPLNHSEPARHGSPLLAVVIMGVCFLFVFTAFQTQQGFMTSVFHSQGNMALGALYITFALGTFISPSIVKYLGERLAMFFGVTTYCMFGLGCALDNFPLLMIASILEGLGAGVLWTAQGSYMTKISTPETIGSLTGVFFSIFFVSLIIGNTFFAAMHSAGYSYTFLFWILFFVEAAGTAGMLFLRPTPPPTVEEKSDETESPAKLIGSTFKLLGDWKMQLCIATFLYSGLSSSYFFGVIPPMIPDDWNWTGYFLTMVGVAEVIGSMGFGRLSDILGMKPVLLLGFAFHAIACGFSYLLNSRPEKIYFGITLSFFGLGDSVLNTQIYKLLKDVFETRQQSSCFAVFKLFQAMASGAAFVYAIYLNAWQNLIALAYLWVAAVVTYLVLDLKLKQQAAHKQDDRQIAIMA